jgi:hypothetical protein
LEFSYINTIREDINKREIYFDETYFLERNTNTRKIYSQIMQEFKSQGDLIKASHIALSPEYFILKERKEDLESHKYLWEHTTHQEIADTIRQELIDINKKLKEHFYYTIDQDKKFV